MKMELQAAWQRAQRFNALIGIRPDIRNKAGDRIEERNDGSVTLTVDDLDIPFDNVDVAKIELQLRGRLDDSWE